MLVVMCQALPISVVSIIPHPIISTNTNNFPKFETLLFVPLFHIALFYLFVHLEDLLQKQIFQKMLHTLHKSLSADRRDWKLFNYYSLKHFLGVKSARMRAQAQSVARRSYRFLLAAGRLLLTPAHPPPPPTARIFSTSLLLV